jgi:hypothetical protein
MHYYNNLIRKIKYHILKSGGIYIFFLIVPLPIFWWFGDGYSLMHGPIQPWPEDSGTMVTNAIQQYYVWLSNGLGGVNSGMNGFLLTFLKSFFLEITGNGHNGQLFFFYFCLVTVLFSMYALCRVFDIGKVAAATASVFYLSFPDTFSGFPIEPINFELVIFFASTPLLLASFVILSRESLFVKKIPMYVLVCLFASLNYSSLQYLVLHLFVISIYGLYNIVFDVEKVNLGLSKKLGRIITSLAIIIAVNLSSILPMAIDLDGSYKARQEPGLSNANDIDMMYGTGSTFLESFSILPSARLQGSLNDWIGYYTNNYISVTFIILMIMSFLYLLKGRDNRYYIFPIFFLLVSLFIAKGILPPFSFAGEVFFTFHQYMVRLFRNMTYFHILVMLPLSLVVAFGVDSAFNFRKKHFIGYLLIIIVWIIGAIHITPFVYGIHKDKNVKIVNVIPEYYIDAAAYIKADKGMGRVNSIPTFSTSNVFVAYDWENTFSGVQPFDRLSDRSVFNPMKSTGNVRLDPALNIILHPTHSNISPEAWRFLLSIGNVEFVTFHKDASFYTYNKVVPDATNGLSIDKIFEFIDNDQSLVWERSFGQIELYRVKDERYLPIFYVPDSVMFKSGDLKGFISDNKNFDTDSKRPAIFFTNQIKDFSFISLLNNESSNDIVLEIKKINPTKYRVIAKNIKNSFPMVFSENFDAHWRVDLVNNTSKHLLIDNNSSGFVSKNYNGVIQNENLLNGSIFEIELSSIWPLSEFVSYKTMQLESNLHKIVNGYANSWIVNVDEICADISTTTFCSVDEDGLYSIEMVVSYNKQLLRYIGTALLLAFIVAILLYYVYSFLVIKALIKIKGKNR